MECCDAAADALRDGFLVHRNEAFFLADLRQGEWLLFGPEVSHCPFCGVRVALGRDPEPEVEAPPTTF